jgi:hypothetical protein
MRLEGVELADQMARDAGHDLHTDHDPVQVQGELHAYLVQRGQQVARDMDLGHVQDDDLAELGRLDCIAQHPGLDPELATRLEMIASTREHNPTPGTGAEGSPPATTSTRTRTRPSRRPRGLRGIVPERTHVR